MTPNEPTTSIVDVLIVDDDPSILEVVSYLLELEGYKVRTATNGKEALDEVHKVLPRLILLDMRMPVMDGWEFCRLFREISPPSNIPLIVMSADRLAHQKASEVSANASLQKPFDMEELLTKIKSLIG